MFASLTQTVFPPSRTDERDRTTPRPPSSGPVLLGDCATAADHTTLLLALWRRWETPPES